MWATAGYVDWGPPLHIPLSSSGTRHITLARVTTMRSVPYMLRIPQSERLDRHPLMTIRTYEITFAGQAVPAVVDAFEGYEVTVDQCQTTLRAEKIDQAALHGAIDRLRALGLELLEVRAVDVAAQ